MICPWEYRHLRAWARARIAGAYLLVLGGLLTLNVGSTGTAYGWAALFLVVAAAQFSFAYWELTIARSASPQT